MPVSIKACREHCDPNNPTEVGVLWNDIDDLCDLIEDQEKRLTFIRETVAPYDGTHCVGWHGQDLMYARLLAIREAIEDA